MSAVSTSSATNVQSRRVIEGLHLPMELAIEDEKAPSIQFSPHARIWKGAPNPAANGWKAVPRMSRTDGEPQVGQKRFGAPHQRQRPWTHGIDDRCRAPMSFAQAARLERRPIGVNGPTAPHRCRTTISRPTASSALIAARASFCESDLVAMVEMIRWLLRAV